MSQHSSSLGMSELFTRYSQDHQNLVNQALHLVCVPLIYWAVIGLVWSLFSWVLTEQQAATAAVAVFTLVLALYYLPKSRAVFLDMVLLSLLGFILLYVLQSLGLSLLYVSLTVFAIGWAGQFIGHYFEGAKPSFFDEIQFLLVGPAWVIDEYKQWFKAKL